MNDLANWLFSYVEEKNEKTFLLAFYERFPEEARLARSPINGRSDWPFLPFGLFAATLHATL